MSAARPYAGDQWCTAPKRWTTGQICTRCWWTAPKLQDAELVYDEAFHGYSVETAGFREMPFEGLYAPKADRRVSQKLRLIPYFSFANREECDMLVWLRTANT